MDNNAHANPASWGIVFLALPLLLLLNLSALHSYLLFHSLAEMFSISLGIGIFLLAWSFRQFEAMAAVVRLGIGFLFVALFDIVHVLSYKGMGIFDSGTDPPTQTWILGRFLEGIALFLFAVFPAWTARVPAIGFKIAYGLFFLGAMVAIYVYPVFPRAHGEEAGQTPFKIISELLICLLFLVAALVVHRRLPQYSPLRLPLITALVVAAITELSFTLYQDVYSILNQIGHNLKVISYYLIYQAIIKTQITVPVRLALGSILNRDVQDVMSEHTRDLLGVLAHDLRSPFATLRSTSEALLSMKDSLTEEDREALIEAIYATSRQANGLFDDLAEWVALQTGSTMRPVQPYLASEEVDKELDLIRFLAKQKNLSFKTSIDEGLLTTVDPQIIRAIVRNLLNNAIRFTPARKQVELVIAQHLGLLKIEVIDQGPGLSEERKKEILNRQRLDRSSGKGMGLFLCQQILERAGGRMIIETRPGSGSRFLAEIPDRGLLD